MIISDSLGVDLVGFVVAFVTILFLYYKWTYQYWQRKNVPHFEASIPFGNSGFPVGGREHNAFQTKRHYDQMKANGWKHGGLFLFLTPRYLVVDLDYVKNIMTKDFHHFNERGLYYNEESDPLSGHLFFVGGQKWRKLRTKLTPTFTSGKMKMMFQTLVDCAPSLVQKIEADRVTKSPIDIKEALGCFTTDIIGSCAFGLDCNSFKEEDAPFRKHGRNVFVSTKMRVVKFLFSANFPNAAKALGISLIPKDMSEFFIKVVKDTVEYREKNNYTRKDFIQLLIDMKNNKLAAGEASKDDSNTMTMEELAAQCFAFFIAGFETSSTTMTFALYQLARNPDVQQKVREEIDIVLAKHDGKITYEAIQELKYMDQVLNETLRMYPPVPLITRRAVSDYKIPDQDITLDKGTFVTIPVFAIHYDKDIYPEPEKFDPDRFTEENKSTRHHYAHIPFGEGPRICIGMRFGLMQSKVGLTTLLKNYKFTINRKTQDPLVMNPKSFVFTAEGGIWLDAEKI